MILTVTIRDDNGQSVGVLVLNPKDFTSGSRGFFGTGKVAIEGKRYQCQAQVVEIGSKGNSNMLENVSPIVEIAE